MQMLSLKGPQRVLCLGAHSDDIEIGCGGTVLTLAAHIPDIEIRWVVFSGTGPRAEEARASATDFLEGVARRTIEVKGYPESYFPAHHTRIKEDFERLKSFDPTLVLTHFKADDHQDHRVVAELSWNTFRNHAILEYEIPKYEDDLARPGLFVPIERAAAERKLAILNRHFGTQKARGWFTDETFMALMRLRGVHANAPTGLAEAFFCRKLCLGV